MVGRILLAIVEEPVKAAAILWAGLIVLGVVLVYSCYAIERWRTARENWRNPK